ncbi:MAG: hypothetical protein F4Y54_06440 [Dehalococcoidia bacterium]|nr:hypothetical protein [Dehalococcoidia bacterium]
MKRWLLAVLVAAVALPFVAHETTGAQPNATTPLQIVLWQDVDSPTDLALSVRPEGGLWRDLGTVPVELARVNSSRSYRYGDLVVAGVEIRVWQPASGLGRHFISARREGGDWYDVGTVPIVLTFRTDDGRYRYGNLTLSLPMPEPDRALLVAVGAEHSCALRASGEIVCWGDNARGQTDAPRGRYRSLSAGEWHTCGLTYASRVVCWGDNFSGQTDAPRGRFRSLSSGLAHTCAVARQGGVVCWGANGNGQGDPPSGTFRSLSAGAAHTCGLRNSGRVECWGDDARGQSDPPNRRYH